VDTYRCAHIGKHPYLLSLRPDGFHQSLTDFLAKLPIWLQKYLRLEQPSLEDMEARAESDIRGERQDQLIQEYEKLLQRIPEEYQKYRDHRQAFLSQFGPTTIMGRPRKDEEAAEAQRLHSHGFSWKQIARAWGATPETLAQEADRIRKLVKLRSSLPPGKKSD
jgi:hypothetical protein